MKNIDKIIPHLPRHSYSASGSQMEPITLVIVGRKHHIVESFKFARWYQADPISVKSVLKSATSTMLNSSYRNGPMWPAYIRARKNQLAFERPTRSDTFRRRHHMRLWKTRLKIDSQPVWVGTLSYDRSVGHFKKSFVPLHHISSKLISEENFLARTFRIARPKYISLSRSELGHMNTGDPYVWDGKAMVLDFSK